MTLATRAEKGPKGAFVYFELRLQCLRNELKYHLFGPCTASRNSQHFLGQCHLTAAQAVPLHWQRLTCRCRAGAETQELESLCALSCCPYLLLVLLLLFFFTSSSSLYHLLKKTYIILLKL